jgi:hypothetical protein
LMVRLIWSIERHKSTNLWEKAQKNLFF